MFLKIRKTNTELVLSILANTDLDDQVVKKLSEAKNRKVAKIEGIKTAVSYTLPLRLALPEK